jgi:AcrR family transcriptional regulator
VPSTRPKRDLTGDEVVARARAIARDDGEEALTMRRVADACGVTVRALYRHVDDKEHLLSLLVDTAIGEMLDQRPGTRHAAGPERLVALGHAIRGALMTEPVVLATLQRRPVIGPGMARLTEEIMHAVDTAGVLPTRRPALTDAFWVLTIGAAGYDQTRPPGVRRQLVDQVDPEELPRTRASIDDYADRNGPDRYEQAVRWLLDGALGPGA